jgi:hypothetical protein
MGDSRGAIQCRSIQLGTNSYWISTELDLYKLVPCTSTFCVVTRAVETTLEGKKTSYLSCPSFQHSQHDAKHDCIF